MFHVKPGFLILGLLILVPACHALAKSDSLPQVTEDGMHLVPDSRLAIVYAEPEADLSLYDSVKILEPYIAFKKNWQRQQRSSSSLGYRISAQDMEKMKAKLAEEFIEVFTKVLTDGGYTVTDQTGESVMLVRPAIINLDAKAPDTRSSTATRTYVQSAGEMTLYIELFDSVTGDKFAKALDRRADGSAINYYTWANPSSNAAAAKRILRGWAEVLRDALDEAHK